MKIKSAILTQASGTLGGLVASRNKGGMYLKANATQVNRSTQGQQRSRSALVHANALWQTISPQQREAWETYAANVPINDNTGTPQTLTGQQHFLRLHTLFPPDWIGPLLPYEAPKIFNLGDTGVLSFLTATQAGQFISIGVSGEPEWTFNPIAFIFPQIALPTNASATARKNRFRNHPPQEGDVAAGQTFDINNLLTTPPIRISTGQRIYVRIRIMQEDGRLSEPIHLDGLVT